LFAPRLLARIGRVPHTDDKLLRAIGLGDVGYIDGKGVVTAAVFANALAVDANDAAKAWRRPPASVP